MHNFEETSELNWQDYGKIAVRRRWFILGPFFAVGILGCMLALVWPTRYRSEAVILVDPQKVADLYVTPNVVANLDDRLQAMTAQILSRTRLVRLIDEFNLYPSERNEDTITNMRKDITIEPVKSAPNAPKTGDLTALRIAYTAPDGYVAQQVVEELTSLFINDNLRSRDQQSSDTTSFLQTQLEDSRQRLEAAQERMRAYKTHYLGELPEQQQSNMEILSSLEAQLNSASSELDHLQQEKTYLESMKAGYKALPSAPIATPAAIRSQVDPLVELKAKLADLQSKYTDLYPDVIRTKQQIARMEAAMPNKANNPADEASASSTVPAATVASASQPGLIEIDSRLKAARVNIASREQEVDSLRQKIQTVQAQLKVSPVREEELAEVSRDYDNAKAQYDSLQQKESQSALATNLEKRQEGDVFQVIDSASLPGKPVEPNRTQIVLGGWLVGLIAGIGLAAALEFIDTRIYGEEDIKKASELPILVKVPELMSSSNAALATRQLWIEALTACLLVVTSLGIGMYLHFWVK